MRNLMVACLLLVVAIAAVNSSPQFSGSTKRTTTRPTTITTKRTTTTTTPKTTTTKRKTTTTTKPTTTTTKHTTTTTTGTSCPTSLFSSGKIVGGIAVSIGDYPYQLSFRYNGAHFCGASIISTIWAVTAAHCCIYDVADLTLKAGSSMRTSGGTIHQVIEQIPHGSYNSGTYDYDIALLKVSDVFVYQTNLVAAIVLPAAGSADVAANTNSTVSGWGTMSPGAQTLPDQLQAVAVPVVSMASCQTSYGTSAITPRMMCAGLDLGGKDSCQGDSGGPLTALVCGTRQLIGVVSWGYSCAQPNYPGVYSSVANLRAWINATAGV